MRMQRLTILILLISVFLPAAAQDKEILMTIGDKDIPLKDFLWMYNKSSQSGQDIDRPSMEEYLEDYITFQRKILEAESLGLDQSDEFRQDVAGYREDLINPHLLHLPTVNELVREAFKRSRYDVHASHILVRLTPDATPQDTLAAYHLISLARERALSGEDFNEVAMEMSEDPAVEYNRGDLQFFTPFSKIYPIETAAYRTRPGDVSEIFRSKLGFHIVKVHSIRPAWGSVSVSHIFVESNESSTPEEQEAAKLKIEKAFRDILRGEKSFEEAVKEYTEDEGTRDLGGYMGWFSVGQMVPEFENAAFSLRDPQMVSAPFKTIYGWHMVMLLDKAPPGSFEELEETFFERVENDERVEFHRQKNISTLRFRYGFEDLSMIPTIIAETADSSLIRAEWKAGDLLQEPTPLFRIGDKTLTGGDFAAYVESHQSKDDRARQGLYYLNELFWRFRDDAVLDYEVEQAVKNNPDIDQLTREYRDGLLLFEISNQKVWSRAGNDKEGLIAFHAKNRENYMWKERTDAWIVTCGPEAELKKIRRKWKKIQNGSLDLKMLNDQYCTSDTVQCVRLYHVLAEDGLYPRVDERKEFPGLGPLYSNPSTKGFVIINEVRPPRPKTLDEARGQVVADYQAWLEEQWLKELEEKFPAKINREVLEKADH